MTSHYQAAPLLQWAESQPIHTLPQLFRQVLQQPGAAARNYLGAKINGVYRYQTYQQVKENIEAFAAALIELGIQSGDRVAQIANNRPEWVVTDFGAMHAAAVHVPLYPTLSPEGIEYILKDCGARIVVAATPAHLQAIVAAESRLPQLEHIIALSPNTAASTRKIWSWSDFLSFGQEARGRRQSDIEDRVQQLRVDDVCSLVYTSGTTGEPKGAMLMHGNFVSNALTARPLLEMRGDDLELSFLPLCHVFERVAYYCVTSVGACIAYAESVDTVAANMKEVRPTLMPSVPRLFEKIHARVMAKVQAGPMLRRQAFFWALSVGKRHYEARARGQLSRALKLEYAMAFKAVLGKLHQETGGRIRLFCSGGAPLRKDVAEFFLSAGFLLTEGYGLTETSPVISFNPLLQPRVGSVGKIIPGVQVRIAEDGEILCQGPNVMRGYFNKPEATREAISDDGWFHTGDIGILDEDGYLTITDRKKDLLVMSNGKNVAPQPIEQLIQGSPWIEQCVVVGDNRKFIAALLVPNYARLAEWARDKGLSGEPEALCQAPQVIELLQKEVEQRCADLSKFEQVKAIAVLAQELSQEAGELTPTLKVKRKVVYQRYAEQIDALYAEEELTKR